MKKNFQVVIFIMLAAVFNMSVSSCSSDGYSSPIKGKTVSDVTFESSQGTNTITIGDADLTGFDIKSYETWCVATAQGKNLNITVQPNTTYDERRARIVVTDPGDQSNISFMVVQKQHDAILIDGKTFNVAEAGGDVTVKVQSNVKYQVEIPSSASWLTSKAATRALENSTIVLSATANNSGDEREATVKLTNTASGVSSEFTVKQDLTPYIIFEKEDYSVDAEGGNIDIIVKSNIDLTISVNDKWIANVNKEKKGDFDFIQTLGVSSFSGNQTKRTAKVTVSDKTGKWNISKDIIITQTINPRLYVHAVDLGLSVKWASCNLGAMKPEDCGWYFAWGELEPKSFYNEDTYLYFFKDIGKDISGTKYDAASVILGGKWRMPTVTELFELINGCTWERIFENNKMKGYKIIGKNGNSIFIPNSGWYYLNNIVSQKELWGATFWTSSKSTVDYGAYTLQDKIDWASPIYNGYPIRPITQ